jgi:hypothetical protein
MFCREQVAQLRDLEPQVQERGARAVVVGCGAPRSIGPFREYTRFQGEIVTDPRREAYEAAGFKKSWGTFFLWQPRSWAAGFRTLRKGFGQGKTQGDPVQNGGALVVRPPGEILWRFASRYPGDHPTAEALLAALPRS